MTRCKQCCAHLAAGNLACNDRDGQVHTPPELCQVQHPLARPACWTAGCCSATLGAALRECQLASLAHGPSALQGPAVQCVCIRLGPYTLGALARAASCMRWAPGYAHLSSTGNCSGTGLGATSTGIHKAERKAEHLQVVVYFPLPELQVAAKSTCLSLTACPQTSVCSPMCRTAAHQ